jgi:hypothetical protein
MGADEFGAEFETEVSASLGAALAACCRALAFAYPHGVDGATRARLVRTLRILARGGERDPEVLAVKALRAMPPAQSRYAA